PADGDRGPQIGRDGGLPGQRGQGAAGDRGIDRVQPGQQGGADVAGLEAAQRGGQRGPVRRVLVLGEFALQRGGGVLVPVPGGRQRGDARVPRGQVPVRGTGRRGGPLPDLGEQVPQGPVGCPGGSQRAEQRAQIHAGRLADLLAQAGHAGRNRSAVTQL